MKRLAVLLLVFWGVLASSATAAIGAEEGDKGTKDITRVYLPRKWALLIGVNNYANVKKLEYCCADIQGLKEHLVKAGFPDDHVLLMYDTASDMKYKPFKNNIDKQLGVLATLTKPDDLIFVAFSGHGVLLKDAKGKKDGTSYLCPADADLEDPVNTMVPLDKVYKTLEACQAKRKLLLVDACRNDPTPAGGKDLGETVAANKEFALALRKELPGGILLLNSCAPGQRSLEDEKIGHGVFMHFFMEGLAGKAAKPTGSIYFLDLFQYAEDKTTVYVWQNKSEAQTPVFSGKDFVDFEFVKLDPTSMGKVIPGHPGNQQSGMTGKENRGQSESTNPMAAIVMEQGNRYFADGNYDAAIHAYTNAIIVDPKNSTLYPKRGAAYLGKGDIKMAVVDYQMGNRPLALTVAVPNTNLMKGDKITAAVHEGQTVSITKIDRESNLDWLWVEAVDGNAAANGWIKMEDVVKKPTPPPSVATQTPANQSGGTASQYYDGEGDDGPSGHPLLDADYNNKQKAADRAQDWADRIGTPGAQRAADAKAAAAERAAERRERAGGRGGR